MDDVMRVAVEQGNAQLPSHRPYLFLGEIFSFQLLLVD